MDEKYCPHCGEKMSWDEDLGQWTCPDCDCTFTNEELEDYE